jgi:hypothetical protein
MTFSLALLTIGGRRITCNSGYTRHFPTHCHVFQPNLCTLAFVNSAHLNRSTAGIGNPLPLNVLKFGQICGSLPTGGGKSLLYLLPALVEEDLTIILILPFIALKLQNMQDGTGLREIERGLFRIHIHWSLFRLRMLSHQPLETISPNFTGPLGYGG